MPVDYVVFCLIRGARLFTIASTGLSDRSAEGRFVWSDGSPLSLSEFYYKPGHAQPDGNDFEDCIMIDFRYSVCALKWY